MEIDELMLLTDDLRRVIQCIDKICHELINVEGYKNEDAALGAVKVLKQLLEFEIDCFLRRQLNKE